MAQQLNRARHAAVWALGEVLQEHRLVSDVTSSPTFQKLPPHDRARAQRLASETLRQLWRIDRILKPLIRKAPPTYVHNVLRLGAWEILASGAARHGVVNDLVNLCGASKRHQGYRGLTNAILRNIDAQWADQPTPQMPKWLRKPLIEAWGQKAVHAMELVQAHAPPIDLTFKDDPTAWVDRLEGTLLPSGSVRISNDKRISTLPGYTEGAWWVQDTAASLPARLLAPARGERVLDLCAAPGGKTLQMAAAGADVTAMDVSAARLLRLQENLKRTGLKANVVAKNMFDHQGQYDAILLDAPCSATGTLRRHPDLAHTRDGHWMAGLIQRQADMLEHAMTLLKPGGRIAYATCSLLPQEGEEQIAALLSKYPELSVVRPDAATLGIEARWITKEGGVRLRPDYWGALGGMDGFYAVCLVRQGA